MFHRVVGCSIVYLLQLLLIMLYTLPFLSVQLIVLVHLGLSGVRRYVLLVAMSVVVLVLALCLWCPIHRNCFGKGRGVCEVSLPIGLLLQWLLEMEAARR